MDACCKNCTNRHINCHSDCKLYDDWKYNRCKENIYNGNIHTIEKMEFNKNLGYIRGLKKK